MIMSDLHIGAQFVWNGNPEFDRNIVYTVVSVKGEVFYCTWNGNEGSPQPISHADCPRYDLLVFPDFELEFTV